MPKIELTKELNLREVDQRAWASIMSDTLAKKLYEYSVS